jgi:two-component system sensor histidine kinase CreC
VKISYRIFSGFVVILAVGFTFLIIWSMSDVSVQPKKSMEESLVDFAHILASYLEQNIRDHKIDTSPLRSFLSRAGKRRFLARIYELNKRSVTLGDVFHTMRGKYGARTTRRVEKDSLSSVAYVAAPIYWSGDIIGVCTVSKEWRSINMFIDTSRRNILLAALVLFAAALVLSFFISRWITRPIRKLKDYSDSVRWGTREKMPELGAGEIGDLGDSFEQMRLSLEDKDYIEQYVQTLTHQLKGPLSAVSGAAELLQEDLPEADRQRFVNNIETESKRLHRIVERMLELASLEHRRELRNVETIDLGELIKDIAAEMTVTLKKKEIVLVLNVGEGNTLRGERFLIHQAVYNLLQNAVEFTPAQGAITVEITRHWGRLILIFTDDGAGIPAYAIDKIFDKFYSLQRPETGKKSSGLGLSLVKEVADLHNGEITIKPHPPRGTSAILKLPVGEE